MGIDSQIGFTAEKYKLFYLKIERNNIFSILVTLTLITNYFKRLLLSISVSLVKSFEKKCEICYSIDNYNKITKFENTKN